MTYTVQWGRGGSRNLTTADELDTLLDEITSSGRPQAVTIYPPGYHDDPDASPWDAPAIEALEIGIGHADRAYVRWLATGAVGSEPGVPPWPEGASDIAFDYGGDPIFCGPERARTTPQAARAAAREYVRTGRRPTGLTWTQDA